MGEGSKELNYQKIKNLIPKIIMSYSGITNYPKIKRHQIILRDNIYGVTVNALKKLVNIDEFDKVVISKDVYTELKTIVYYNLHLVMEKSVKSMDKKLTTDDIICAFRHFDVFIHLEPLEREKEDNILYIKFKENEKLFIPKLSFKRLVIECSQNYYNMDYFPLSKDVLYMIHFVVERMVTKLTKYAKREMTSMSDKKLMAKHYRLLYDRYIILGIEPPNAPYKID
jgi:hypothetical protein